VKKIEKKGNKKKMAMQASAQRKKKVGEKWL
jgi:hypothetical protein